MPKQYPLSKQVAVMVFALTKGPREASRWFKVPRRTIQRWLRQYRQALLEITAPPQEFKLPKNNQ